MEGGDEARLLFHGAEIPHNDTTTPQILQSAINEGVFPWTVERASGSELKLHYGALNMAVLTLGLLLIVEALRRQLDRSASGRQFFQAVLEGVYRELSSLGVVELFIHLVQKYSPTEDKNKKELFSDLHFLLFYTAIFNAIQSVILALFSNHISYRTWVRTEELELSHYVEIREEFDRVRKELYGEEEDESAPPVLEGEARDSSNSDATDNHNVAAALDPMGASITEYRNARHKTWGDVIRKACWGIFYTIKYPRLKAKYKELLVQVRFHELRVHFLQAYDLPLKLKVSSYLMRSKQNVLKHLIHVSTAAWLWLTALMNVLYFITGMIAEITGESGSTEWTLRSCFFIGMVLFIVIGLLLWRQMNHIFMKIMDMKHLWDFAEQDPTAGNHADNITTNMASTRKAKYQDPALAAEQLNLFFLGDPRLVVSAIQFMQFGYAIALSLVVVFWREMNSGGHFSAKVYLVATLICYGFFVLVVSRILPRYTMCTSLGQLVDRKRLHETVAMFRLEEAERRRKQEMDNSFVPRQPTRTPVTDNAQQHPQDKVLSESGRPSKYDTLLSDLSDGRPDEEAPNSHEIPDSAQRSMEPPILPIRSSERSAAANTPLASPTVASTSEHPGAPSLPAITEKETLQPEKATLLVDLVKMDTSSLRQAVPLDNIRKAEAKDRRRNRRKSVSDGVALMSQLGNIGKVGQGTFAMSDAANQYLFEKPKEKDPPEHVKLSERLHKKTTVDDSVLVERRDRRRNRKKAVSSSAAIAAMRDMTDKERTNEDMMPMKKADYWKTDNVEKFSTNKRSNVPGPSSTSSPFQKLRKPFASSDDSATAAIAAKQRNERRRQDRKKALSASAAVRLMRDYPDEESDKLSMEDFWSQCRSDRHADTANGDKSGVHDSHADPEKSPTASGLFEPAYDPFNSTATEGLSPVREVSAHFEDSNHFDNMQALPTFSPDRHGLGTSSEKELTSNGSSLHGKDAEDDDEETVDTAGSVGGLSDVDDVDYANGFYRHNSLFDDEADENHLSLCERCSRLNNAMRTFFCSQRYGFVTHMLGTMVCFFLVGMRVEGFLQEQCIVPFDDNSWDLNLDHSFWLIVAWLGQFIIISIYIALLFVPCLNRRQEDMSNKTGAYAETKHKQWTMFLAAIYDIIISAGCLAVFLGAEIQRCCTEGDGSGYPAEPLSENATRNLYRRFLGAALNAHQQQDCHDRTLLCKCSQFGTRLMGSVGSVEPFTSLIALRVFRFLLARRTVQRLNLGSDKLQEAKEDLASSRHSPVDKSHYAGGTIHDGHEENGLDHVTIVELWQAAIAKHPEIVDKYGEFSGELLQAMLGLKIQDQNLRSSPQNLSSRDHELFDTRKPKENQNGSAGGEHTESFPSNNNVNEPITLDKKKYSKLSTGAQEIIAAGKVGMPCKVKSGADLEGSGSGSASQNPSTNNFGLYKEGMEQPNQSPQMEFEVDVAQMELDKLGSNSTFEFPTARLIRSMRRCERKLLPLLDTWMPVDVVMTKHEIVYVHVSECDGFDDAEQARAAGQQALKATKGGKGLRLCDVTAGRRVVGQLKFPDIISVFVEREFCTLEAEGKSGEKTKVEYSHGHVEYWQDDPDDIMDSPSMDEIHKRWKSVNQDALKIHTVQGTLYLRFYSDLEDAEGKPARTNEVDIGRPVYKDIALQWAQTVVRLCNVGQLKQPLPHFGSNDHDELRDLIQVVLREEKQGNHRRLASGTLRRHLGGSHRRVYSSMRASMNSGEFGGLPILDPGVSNQGGLLENDDANHPLRRNSANATDASPSLQRIPRPRRITRFGSYNEQDMNFSSLPRDDVSDGRPLSID